MTWEWRPSPSTQQKILQTSEAIRNVKETARVQLLKLVSWLRRQQIINLTEPENPRARAKKVIPPRSPLPKRINRVTNPAAPDMPRAKRTSAEVAAAKAEKAQLLQRLDELNKQNKLALAEMEINEEEEEAREERTVVRRIEDLVPEAHNEVCPVHPVEPRDDELEEFPMDEDEPLSIQDEKDEPSRLEGERIDVQIQPVSWMLPRGFTTNYNNR